MMAPGVGPFLPISSKYFSCLFYGLIPHLLLKSFLHLFPSKRHLTSSTSNTVPVTLLIFGPQKAAPRPPQWGSAFLHVPRGKALGKFAPTLSPLATPSFHLWSRWLSLPSFPVPWDIAKLIFSTYLPTCILCPNTHMHTHTHITHTELTEKAICYHETIHSDPDIEWSVLSLGFPGTRARKKKLAFTLKKKNAETKSYLSQDLKEKGFQIPAALALKCVTLTSLRPGWPGIGASHWWALVSWGSRQVGEWGSQPCCSEEPSLLHKASWDGDC